MKGIFIVLQLGKLFQMFPIHQPVQTSVPGWGRKAELAHTHQKTFILEISLMSFLILTRCQIVLIVRSPPARSGPPTAARSPSHPTWGPRGWEAQTLQCRRGAERLQWWDHPETAKFGFKVEQNSNI